VKSSVDGVAYLNVVLNIARPRLTGEYLETSSDPRIASCRAVGKSSKFVSFPKLGVTGSA